MTRSTSCTDISIRSRSSCSTSSALSSLVVLIWSICTRFLISVSTLVRSSSTSIIVSIRFSDTIVIRFYFSILIRRRRYSSACTIFTRLSTLTRSTCLRCVLALLIITRSTWFFLIILTTWCCLTRSTSRTVISIRSRSTCSTSSALSSLVVLIWSICSRILISARFRCSTLVRSSNPSVVISTWFSLVFITSLVLIRRRRYSSACTIFTRLSILTRSTCLRCVLALLISTRSAWFFLTIWRCLTRSTSCTVISIRSRSSCSACSTLSSLVVIFRCSSSRSTSRTVISFRCRSTCSACSTLSSLIIFISRWSHSSSCILIASLRFSLCICSPCILSCPCFSCTRFRLSTLSILSCSSRLWSCGSIIISITWLSILIVWSRCSLIRFSFARSTCSILSITS